ncbi:hypothetical protein LZP73_15325 [Shewanella sp. AS16]|uniref:hypothetical protein n=1 Tax=Shewanella sp. AS16 TaxID=2907625 RepID=UPI001F456E60|nr:hypothetical protein [Shewanella sp. AS16]MCE9687558.1 hypothetical protein [Shewanella sp. AS16]
MKLNHQRYPHPRYWHLRHLHLSYPQELAGLALQKMAEGDDIRDLASDARANGNITVANPAAGAKVTGIMLESQAMTRALEQGA